MLSEEETEKLKEQILRYIDANFPEDKKENAKEQIEAMNSEEFEEFLEKNNMIKKEENECIFCSIISEKISSYKIGENEDAVAVLEINPISKAHSLIIPKNHDAGLKSEKIAELEKKISKKIMSVFKPKEVKAVPSELMGHKVMNLLPVYSDESMKSKREKASPEELEEISRKLAEKEKPKTERIKKPKIKKIKEEKLWLPKRIP